MRMTRWGLGAAGLAAAGAIALAAISIGGPASAQVAPEDEETRGERYRELLAEELGITVEELTEAQTAARDRLIDEKVAEGVLTEEQAERLKALEPGEGLRFGLGKHAMGHRIHHAILSLFETAADVVGIETAELRERLAGGESLVEIAESQGKNEETLRTELVAAITEAINGAVAEGNLEQEKADMLLERVDEMVERAINAELPFEGRFRFDGPLREFREQHRN